MNNLEDWEHASQKDFVYLLEQALQEEQEFWEWYHNVHNRKPAKIVTVKIPQKDELRQDNFLPF